MATTIEQKPNLLSAVNTPLIYMLKESSSAIYNGFKFRYVLKVSVNGTEIAVLKIHKNQQNVGIFNISHILKTYLDTQLTNTNSTSYSVHTLGTQVTTKPFGQNDNQLIEVRVDAFHEVASSATNAPVLAPASGQDNATNYVTPATTPYEKTASNVGGLDINGTNFPLSFFMNSDTDEDNHKFLTNAPTVQFVRGSSTSADNIDLMTICFKQGNNNSTPASLITQGEKLDYIAVQYFDSAGSSISGTIGGNTVEFFANTTTNGGAAANQSDTVGKAILYFGCGTKNLEEQTRNAQARPSNFSNWAYYRIFGCTNNDITDRVTKYYNFYRYGASRKEIDDRHQSCTRYDNVRLAWRNRLGAWDYMNFRGKSTESLDIKSEEMSRVVGNWDSASDSVDFNYNNWDRGRETLFTESQKKLVINSDYLNEEEAVWLQELFTSINVQILDDNGVEFPVIITNKSYTKKTSVNNKMKIQYTINLEFANKERTNS